MDLICLDMAQGQIVSLKVYPSILIFCQVWPTHDEHPLLLERLIPLNPTKSPQIEIDLLQVFVPSNVRDLVTLSNTNENLLQVLSH